MKFITLMLLLCSYAMANSNDLTHRPKSFSYSNGKAIFVDFTEANYQIGYDLMARSASVKAEIKFNAPEAGNVVFDVVNKPTSILLDGISVSSTEISTPQDETKVRVIDTPTSVGKHTMVIEVPLTELVTYKSEGVRSAFWTSDLDERSYLEQYLPSNFEFDQVKMTFVVKIMGAKAKHMIYTNGVQEEIDSNTFKITYPEYFTASSLFYHLVPKGSLDELRFTLKSIDGRTLPAVVYTNKSLLTTNAKLDAVKKDLTEVFQELESDYGAFLHSQIIVYIAGAGGMEYCGATMTDRSSLGHELFHSYFARGMMPANGNSGWLDEALASWRDDDYPRSDSLSGGSGMSSHPYYTRITDMAAYSFGKRFMSYLDGKLKDKGGLKPFMRYVVDKKSLSPLFVEEFITELNKFYGMNLTNDFKTYTYGKSILKSKEESVHRKMSIKELRNFL
ncbi:MAG: hypothetical protein AB7I27_15145 [Bacteriovoracaceae bacterium]